MFENLFGRLGKKVAKHSGKVILAWVIALVILAPFSIVFFSNVNFDIANNIVSQNSMSNEAATLLTSEFGNNSLAGSSGSQVIIFINNTNLNTIQDYQILKNMTTALNHSASSISSFQSISSVFSVASVALSSYSNGTKQELGGTYSLIQSLNAGVYNLSENVNSTLSLEFGLPLNFVELYLGFLNNTSMPATLGNATASNYYAYSAMQSEFAGNPADALQLAYLNSFTNAYWNSTVSGATNQTMSLYLMNISVGNLFLSNASQLYQLLAVSGELQLYQMMAGLAMEYSLMDYAQSWAQNFVPTEEFVANYSVTAVANQIATEPETAPLLSALNVSALSLTWDSYNLSATPVRHTLFGPVEPGSVLNLSIHLVLSSSAPVFKSFDTNPYYHINTSLLEPYLAFLNDSSSSEEAVSAWVGNHTIAEFPIYPTSVITGNFVNSKSTAMLLFLSFNANITDQNFSALINETTTFVNQINGASVLGISSTTQATEYSSQFTNGLVTALALGIALSIILIGAFFRSPVAAFLPLLMFMFSAILGMGINGIIYKYLLHEQVSFITPTLLLILVLGLTTDYMVYIMARYRRELRNGNPDAVQVAAKWSGHAVFTSGLTVTLSYIVLWLSNIPIFSDSGLTNAIGIGVTILLANTLLIALLSRYGRKIFWPTHTSLEGRIPLERGMKKVGFFTVTNKKKLMVVFAVISLITIYIYMNTPTGLDVFGLLPKGNSAINLVNDVNYTFGSDMLDQNYVILKLPSSIYTNSSGVITFNATDMNIITAVENKIASQNGVAAVSGPTYPFGYYQDYTLNNVSSTNTQIYLSQMMGYIGNDTHYAQIGVTMKNLGWTPNSMQVTTNIDNNLSALETTYSNAGSGFTYYMGGTTQGLNDVFSYAYSTFLLAVPVLAVAIFAVLFIQLFSIFTPMRLILMVLLAVVMSLAVTYIFIFHFLGWSLIIFLPIFVVITLLAVGLDYDIFMITRVKEEIERGSSTEEAIVTTVKENGGVIVVLGMLLFVTFISLAFTGIPIMLEIGFGLAVGVIIDTFISWPFFVPVVMLYLKKYNWWPSSLPVNEGDSSGLTSIEKRELEDLKRSKKRKRRKTQ